MSPGSQAAPGAPAGPGSSPVACAVTSGLSHREGNSSPRHTPLGVVCGGREDSACSVRAALASLACALVHVRGSNLPLYSTALNSLVVFENTAISSAAESSSVLMPSCYSLVTPVIPPCYSSYPSVLFLLENIKVFCQKGLLYLLLNITIAIV